jgi:hypothetical protein
MSSYPLHLRKLDILMRQVCSNKETGWHSQPDVENWDSHEKAKEADRIEEINSAPDDG